MATTLHDYREPADICRAHGWTPGTQLVGDQGYGPTIIEITAIGEREILAKIVQSHMIDVWIGNESTWGLADRDWLPADASQRPVDVTNHPQAVTDTTQPTPLTTDDPDGPIALDTP